MVVHRILPLALLLAPSQAGRAQDPPRIEVRVDPRVELVTAVARIAGFREFTMENADSPYAREVDRHFGAFREHAAVKTLIELRAKNGVSYDAIASFAVHVGPLPGLAERIPFDAPPERLDARFGLEGGRRFLSELRDLARVAEAEEFFARHTALYEETAKRMRARLEGSPALNWFDAFFGARPGARYSAIPGLLCGGANYGVGVRGPDLDEITPVFGCHEWDEAGIPVFSESFEPLLVHELCHSYTNPIVDRFERELAAAGQRLHASASAALKRQGYGTWKTVVYETFVRACVVRCRYDTGGEEAGAKQERAEVQQNFPWVPGIAKLLSEYTADRAKYPTFDRFVPRIVAALEAHAKELAALEERAPHLVSIQPADGARDVDPALAALVLRFDKPMKPGSWSFTGDAKDQPAWSGEPSYDAERRVLTVPAKLEPGKSYRFGLNSERQQGFQSADGVPLAPLDISFTTRPAPK